MTRKTLTLALVLLGTAFGSQSAGAWTTGADQKAYSSANIRPQVADPNAALDQSQGNSHANGYTFGNSGLSMGISGGNARQEHSTFPGLDNHMSPTDNVRALQYGVMPR